MVIRNSDECVWAFRSDVQPDVVDEVERLLGEEPRPTGLHQAPIHAAKYREWIDGPVRSGPAFTFPASLVPSPEVALVDDEALLQRHFSGWRQGEIDGGRFPVLAIRENGHPISICFSARSSDLAAEAGVETAPHWRGRGLGAMVTAAWAVAILASGRTPLYSTEWSNTASLALARNLRLRSFAQDWSIVDPDDPGF